jgi:hypothetical protein
LVVGDNTSNGKNHIYKYINRNGGKATKNEYVSKRLSCDDDVKDKCTIPQPAYIFK